MEGDRKTLIEEDKCHCLELNQSGTTVKVPVLPGLVVVYRTAKY